MSQFTTDLFDLRLCDNMELMAQYPDKHFDLAIVDPPYGIGIDGQTETKNKQRNPKQNRKKHEKKGWDSTAPGKEYFQELFRVSKNQIIWGANYFVTKLSKETKGWIVWDKMQHGLTMSDCELAFSSFDCPTRVFCLNRVALLTDGTIHPTQKPVALYKWLLHNYAKQGDKILDTHLGSMSIAMACHDYGFHLTGCELDPDYFAAGVQRVQSHIKQLTLF